MGDWGGGGPPLNTPLFHDLTDAYTSPWHWVNRNFEGTGANTTFCRGNFQGIINV